MNKREKLLNAKGIILKDFNYGIKYENKRENNEEIYALYVNDDKVGILIENTHSKTHKYILQFHNTTLLPTNYKNKSYKTLENAAAGAFELLFSATLINELRKELWKS